jgi:hypothetical protein
MTEDRPNPDMRRRTILVGATTALIAPSIVGADKTALAAHVPTDAELDTFIRLSSALVGVPRAKLLPNVDEPNLKAEYFRWLRDNAEPTFGLLLGTVLALSPNNAGIKDAILEMGKKDLDVRYLARSIVLLWYLGAWYEPAALRALAEAPDPRAVFVPSKILSAKSYTRSWIWRVAQAHPMGYSEMQFGYWAKVPTPTTSVIGEP